MIDSFRQPWLQSFFDQSASHRRIPADIESALARKLDILDMADTEADLRIPPNNRFEHLKGRLAGRCSIRVNRQYRLIFAWHAGVAADVTLDPHTYRR